MGNRYMTNNKNKLFSNSIFSFIFLLLLVANIANASEGVWEFTGIKWSADESDFTCETVDVRDGFFWCEGYDQIGSAVAKEPYENEIISFDRSVTDCTYNNAPGTCTRTYELINENEGVYILVKWVCLINGHRYKIKTR